MSAFFALRHRIGSGFMIVALFLYCFYSFDELVANFRWVWMFSAMLSYALLWIAVVHDMRTHKKSPR